MQGDGSKTSLVAATYQGRVHRRFQKEVQPCGFERIEGYKRPRISKSNAQSALSANFHASSMKHQILKI